MALDTCTCVVLENRPPVDNTVLGIDIDQIILYVYILFMYYYLSFHTIAIKLIVVMTIL